MAEELLWTGASEGLIFTPLTPLSGSGVSAGVTIGLGFLEKLFFWGVVGIVFIQKISITEITRRKKPMTINFSPILFLSVDKFLKIHKYGPPGRERAPPQGIDATGEVLVNHVQEPELDIQDRNAKGDQVEGNPTQKPTSWPSVCDQTGQIHHDRRHAQDRHQ